MSLLLIIFFLTLPLTYIYSIKYLTINYIVVMAISLAAVLKKDNGSRGYPASDFLIYIFFIIICTFSFLINNNTGDLTFIKHTLSYSFILISYGMLLPVYLKKSSIKIEKILKWISVSVFITCSFALVEFAARNLFPSLLSVFNLLGIDTVLKYDALYFEVYQRSRAFMTESGHYAMFVNAFLPISLYYIYRYKGIAAFLIYFIICSLGYLVSFSAGAFASLAAAFLAAFLFYTIEKHSKKSILLFSTALIFVMIVFYYIKDISFFQGIMEKVLFVNDSGRLWRWQFSLDSFLNADFFQMIFGRGLGFLSYTYSTGSTNWFIEATVETGLLGIITIILILLISIKRILQMKYEFKYFIFIGITAMIIQYNLISDYWYPWIWTTIALSSYFRYLEKKAGEEK